MAKFIQFTKLEGTGNDYVYVDLFKENLTDAPKLAREISQRRKGVGSDGLILIAPSTRADVRMIMYNADGSRAEMCGNGIRCVGKYAWDYGLVKRTAIRVETDAGILGLELFPDRNNKITEVSVNMGAPILMASKIPSTLNSDRVIDHLFKFPQFQIRGTLVSMGNPHMVTFVENVNEVPIEEWGPIIEQDARFPNRINIEFVQVVSNSEVIQRTWERGSGETWSCGTGASAVCVAGVLTQRTGNEVLIHLTGGNLKLSWQGDENPVTMRGDTREVFSGRWPL